MSLNRYFDESRKLKYNSVETGVSKLNQPSQINPKKCAFKANSDEQTSVN